MQCFGVFVHISSSEVRSVDQFLVAAGSNHEHMDCLATHTIYLFPNVFKWKYLLPSPLNRWECLLTQTQSYNITIRTYLTYVFYRCLYKNPSNPSFRKSYKAIEPWISEISFYQLDGLLCTHVLILSLYATSLLPV